MKLPENYKWLSFASTAEIYFKEERIGGYPIPYRMKRADLFSYHWKNTKRIIRDHIHKTKSCK